MRFWKRKFGTGGKERGFTSNADIRHLFTVIYAMQY